MVTQDDTMRSREPSEIHESEEDGEFENEVSEDALCELAEDCIRMDAVIIFRPILKVFRKRYRKDEGPRLNRSQAIKVMSKLVDNFVLRLKTDAKCRNLALNGTVRRFTVRHYNMFQCDTTVGESFRVMVLLIAQMATEQSFAEHILVRARIIGELI